MGSYRLGGFVNYAPVGSDESQAMNMGIDTIVEFDFTWLTLPPNPVREGYNFAGWYFDENGTLPYDNSPIFEDTKLYAVWVIKNFGVSFDSKGAGEVETQFITWNESIINLPIVTKTGYDFIGWLLPNGTLYVNQPITDYITLTAKWEPKTYTVTFYVQSEIYKTITVKYGESLVKAIQRANLDINIKSITNNDGSPIDTAINDLTVTTDMSAEADLKSTAQRAVASWWKLLIGAALGIALVAFLCCIPSMVKGKKQRRKG